MRIYLLAFLCLVIGCSDVRAQVAISQLPGATQPLAGTEVVAGVQSGQTVKIPTTAISPCIQFGTSAGTCAQGNAAVSSITCFGTAITSTGTCTTTGQIPGTTTNDSASAGRVGQYVSSTVLVGSAVSLTNATPADITSISLTAGDWDVSGTVVIGTAGSTVVTQIYGWVSTTSATLPTFPNSGALFFNGATLPAGQGMISPTGTIRISVAGTTTVYMSTQVSFTTSTAQAYGFLQARRAR